MLGNVLHTSSSSENIRKWVEDNVLMSIVKEGEKKLFASTIMRSGTNLKSERIFC
jgi:prophage antirepressor-like protein